jgi:hypothetical protein
LENGVCVVDSDANGGSASGSGGSSGTGGVSGRGGSTGGGGSEASGGADAGPGADAGASASGGSAAGSAQDADPDAYCTGARLPLNSRTAPVDLIWAVDTSGSMIEEAAAVQETVNTVVQSISGAGLDVHVVMLAGRPTCVFDGGFCTPGICVPPPLGSGRCPDDSKPPSFFHHPNAVVGSTDAARVFVERFGDYKSTLRASSQKHLLVVTDDDSTTTMAGVYADNAARFIADYTALDPMLADSPARGRVWRMSGMYAATQCPNAARIGQVWKTIIDQTGGVHADICACMAGQQQTCTQTVQQWSAAITNRTVVSAELVECEWGIPPLPVGQALDVEGVRVELTDTASGMRTILPRVANSAACDAQQGGWYFDDPANPTTILACPATCALVKATAQREVSMLLRCRPL